MSDLPVPIRIVLIEPHVLVRDSLAALLERENAFCIVGGTGNLQDALELIAREQPDIVLFEPAGLEEEGFKFIGQFRTVAPNARLIMVTQLSDVALHHRAVQLGVTGIVSKDQTAKTLIKAIHKVHAGEAWLDRSMMADVITRFMHGQGTVESPEQARIAALTPREREIIMLIGKGLKNKEVAERLSVSEFTVRHHLTSIFSKLQVNDRLELIIFAYKYGLVDLPK